MKSRGTRIGIGALLAVLLLNGCSVQTVKPWQRGTLAQPVMAWEADPLLAEYRQHVQYSKEAASGGAGLGGGGCGCN